MSETWPRFLWDLTVSSFQEVSTEIQAGTWRQELMQTLWRGAVYCLLLMTFSACLLNSTRDHQPRGGLAHRRSGVDSFSVEVSFCKMALGSFKLDIRLTCTLFMM